MIASVRRVITWIIGQKISTSVAFLFVSALPLWPETVRAKLAAEEFTQQIWKKEHGLPNDTVHAVLQTRDGYLWIATRGGLARFDGIKFVVFNHVNTPEMLSDHCTSLAEDTEGTLWIGTKHGVLRRQLNRFSRLGIADGLASEAINVLCASPNGGLWIGTDQGLNHFQNGALSFHYLHWTPSNQFIQALCHDGSATLWVGTSSELFRYDEDADRMSITEWATVTRPGWPVWALSGHPDGSVGVLSLKLARFRDDHVESLVDEEFAYYPVGNFLVRTSDGALWTNGGRSGLGRWWNGEWSRFALLPGDRDLQALCFYPDREGNLWIGTRDGGLYRWRKRDFTLLGGIDENEADSVWAICATGDGSLLAGSDVAVSRYTARSASEGAGTISHFAIPLVRALEAARNGDVWIGTTTDLIRWRNGKFESIEFPRSDPPNAIRTIITGRHDTLWMGTSRGLHRLRDGAWTRWTSTNGLARNDVRALHEDRSSRLWIGTGGGGINVFTWQNPETSSEAHIPSESPRCAHFTTRDGLSSNFVWAFYEDAEGVVWIATERGLTRFQDGVFFPMTADHGLVDEPINSILEDDSGNLWFSTPRAVCRAAKEELNSIAAGRASSARCVVFDEAYGLHSGEIHGQESQPASCKTADGRLLFATSAGVVVIDPSCIQANTNLPTVVIEQVRCGNVIVFSNYPGAEQHEKRSKNYPDIAPGSARTEHKDIPRVPPGSGRSLDFEFTTTSLISPHRARFQYQLEGYDDRWQDGGSRRAAYYTNLRPGRYTFRVRACNNHNVWNETGAAFAFYLEPYFYQSWWFFGLSAGGGIFLIYGTVVLRMEHLRRIHQLERQIALEEQRNRIARDIHDELGLNLSQIARLADSNDRLKGLAAPAEPAATRIGDLAEAAVNSIEEIVWANNSRYDTLEDLVAFLREQAARSVADTSIQAHFDFPNEVPSRAVSGLFRRHIVAVLKEALHNVLKHAGASQVQIRLTLTDDILELQITDDGRGLPAEATSRFGNGLVNMRTRLAEIGGSLDIHSVAPAGVTVAVRTPLP